MATVHHQSAAKTCESKFIQPFPPECRVIVDYVDDDRLHPVIESENPQKPKTEATDSENSSGRENPMARIKRFQQKETARSSRMRVIRILRETLTIRLKKNRMKMIEAECRKIEFARLLEEHAQVIRRLKQMEETESTLHFPNTMANVSKA